MKFKLNKKQEDALILFGVFLGFEAMFAFWGVMGSYPTGCTRRTMSALQGAGFGAALLPCLIAFVLFSIGVGNLIEWGKRQLPLLSA